MIFDDNNFLMAAKEDFFSTVFFCKYYICGGRVVLLVVVVEYFWILFLSLSASSTDAAESVLRYIGTIRPSSMLFSIDVSLFALRACMSVRFLKEKFYKILSVRNRIRTTLK